jgi:DNA modification methylase
MYKNRIIEQKMMSTLELKENPKNWRKHPLHQEEGLNAVLNDVGWVQAVIFNIGTGRLLDGHLRVKLAIKNGEPEVPVTVVDLTEEEEDTVLTTLDPLTIMAQTNHDALSALISRINTTNPALKDLIDRIQKKAKIVANPQQDGGVFAAPPRVQLGELWKLGQHLLICADCTINTSWDTLLGDARAELCFTSPPYNVGKTAGVKDLKRYSNSEDSATSESYLGLLQGFTSNALDNCDEVLVNVGLASGNKKEVIQYLGHYADAFKDVIYWLKTSAAPHIQDGIINNRVEPIYAFGDGTRKFRHANFPQGTYWNVIEGSGAASNEYSDVHKATFPLYLPQNIVSNFTKSGESVVDPFMGTGTTLMACEIEGRKCYGIELDPTYCDLTIARWERQTGKIAEKL